MNYAGNSIAIELELIEKKINQILNRHLLITENRLKEELTFHSSRLKEMNDNDLLDVALQHMLSQKQIQRWDPYVGINPKPLGTDECVYMKASLVSFDPIPLPEPQMAEHTMQKQPQIPLSLANRLAAAACRGSGICEAISPKIDGYCAVCRRMSAAVAAELALDLRERHGGSSQVADMLDGLLG